MCSSILLHCCREMTLNLECQGSEQAKSRRVFSCIKQLEIGNAFLQETHICNSDINHLLTVWAGQHSHSALQAKLRVVSVLRKTYSGGKKFLDSLCI